MRKNKSWVKPELKSMIKPIETVFVWNSGLPDSRPWENPPPQQMVFLTRIKNFFFGKNELIA